MNAFKKGTPLVDDLLATLERDGIVSLPGLFDAEALARMQRDFTARVQHVCCQQGRCGACCAYSGW